MDIFLASGSQRRKDLLMHVGINPTVLIPSIDEGECGEDEEKYVLDLARAKADDVIARNDLKQGLVIAADTIGMINAKPFGKPTDRDHAKRMLEMLSGDTHMVITGLVVIDVASGESKTHIEKSMVTFHELSEPEIEWYLDTEEFVDKAGSYGIQDKGSLLVKEVEGDYYNVVGLPISVVWRIIKNFGWTPEKEL